MHLKKIALTVTLLSFSNILFADDHLGKEIQELKTKLEMLEHKSKQQEHQLTKINTVNATVVQEQNRNLEIKPYGFIRFDMAHHFQGSDKIFNTINTVPFDDALNVNSRTLYNVNTSRLGLDVQSKNNGKNIAGKIEVDFRGGSSNDQLRIRHAYIKVDNWLFGQTTSPFVSADIIPEKLDFMANLGGAIQRNPMIQYEKNLDTNLKAWIAFEDASNQRNEDDQTRLPALTTKIQVRSEDRKSVLSARALVLQKKTSNDEKLAWGVGLGGVYQINETNKLHADYYHVKGDSKYVLFSNNAYVINNNHNEKEMVLNEFDSLALGLTHQWNPTLRSTIWLAAMIAKDGAYSELAPDANESLYQGWINIFYNPTKPLTYGLEYVHGERTTFSNQEGTDSRLEAMVRYSF